MQNKRLLITGAFGLVGSNICKVLERDFPEVKITKVKCDDLNDVDPGFDYIIHAAGYGQPLKFSQDKLQTIRVNTDLTDRLFDYLRIGGTFLFISSSEVYSGALSPHTENMIGTTTPQHPRACYIEGKRCGEAICMANKDMFNVKIARLALAYGPGTKKGDTRVINQFIEQALTTGIIAMKDRGQAVRTYAFIGDVVDQLLWILTKGDKTVYNVGGISNTTIAALAAGISYLTDATLIVGNDSLEGAPEEVKLDMSWWHNKFTPLDEGLKLTIDYQRKLYESN